MQAASDIFLGWSRTETHDFYVRQLRDMKVSAEVDTFKPSTLVAYATLCGWTSRVPTRRLGVRPESPGI